MDVCSIHQQTTEELKKDLGALRASIHDIRDFLNKLNFKLETLLNIPIKNGGGLTMTVSNVELQQRLYDDIKGLKENVKEITNSDNLINIVKSNKEEIAEIFDEYRAKRKDSKTVQWNNKLQFIMFLIAIVSVLVNIILFIYLGR